MYRLLMACMVCASLWSAASAVEPPRNPMSVDVGIFVIDITNFNQQENTFDVELDVVTSWQDPRRGFEPDKNAKPYRMFRGDAALAEMAERAVKRARRE